MPINKRLLFTTTKMILRDTAQTLMEAITKSNCLIKCLKIFEGRHFYLRRQSQLTVSQNAFTEADILFTEVVKIARIVKSIYGDSQNCLSRKINLR
jgi:hypothetical protein